MRRLVGIAALLAGCATDDPCVEMCARSTDRYAECLSDWDAAWSDAGYADAGDHTDACETWAWEMRLLEDDAVDRGDIDATGHVDAACADHAATLASGGCAAWQSIDWSTPPWRSSTESE